MIKLLKVRTICTYPLMLLEGKFMLDSNCFVFASISLYPNNKTDGFYSVDYLTAIQKDLDIYDISDTIPENIRYRMIHMLEKIRDFSDGHYDKTEKWHDVSHWKDISINKALNLYDNTPGGKGIVDADTILADIIGQADFQESGIGRDLLEIYKKSNDRDTLNQMFYCITGVEFSTYLNQCVEETTRKNEERDVAQSIIDLFENLLDDKDITIPSIDDEQRDNDNRARIYGTEYFTLEDQIVSLLREADD